MSSPSITQFYMRPSSTIYRGEEGTTLFLEIDNISTLLDVRATITESDQKTDGTWTQSIIRNVTVLDNRVMSHNYYAAETNNWLYDKRRFTLVVYFKTPDNPNLEQNISESIEIRVADRPTTTTTTTTVLAPPGCIEYFYLSPSTIGQGDPTAIYWKVNNPYSSESVNTSIKDEDDTYIVDEWDHKTDAFINLLSETTITYPIKIKTFTLTLMIWNPTENRYEYATATTTLNVQAQPLTTTSTTTEVGTTTTTTTRSGVYIYTATPTTSTTTTQIPTLPIDSRVNTRTASILRVETMVVDDTETIGTDSSDSKSTLNTINSRALSFGPLAPGQTSSTAIIYLKVPSSVVANNIRLALIDCGGLDFSDTKFGVEIQTFIDYNIIPSNEFQGINTTKDYNSSYNVSIGNKDLQSSNYVYLNVTIPLGQVFGSGTIRYCWFFDYA